MKTIKKLKLENKKIIHYQKDILKNVTNFYKNLLSNGDSCLKIKELESLLDINNINELDKSESAALEGEIRLTELAIKNTENQTPGIDGIPAEFLKMFWSKLKFFILRSLNNSFRIGELPQSFPCLPKGNKPREFLKTGTRFRF